MDEVRHDVKLGDERRADGSSGSPVSRNTALAERVSLPPDPSYVGLNLAAGKCNEGSGDGWDILSMATEPVAMGPLPKSLRLDSPAAEKGSE